MTTWKRPARRADEIRQRRATKSHKGLPTGAHRRSRRAAVAGAPPPILVRGSLVGASVPWSRRPKRARRRFDLTLSTPGAEMRLPSLPRVAVGWRLASGLLVCVLGFLLYTLWNSPTFRVSEIEVRGLRRLSAQDINAAAGVAGKPVFTLVPEELRAGLQAAFPELSSVSLEVSLPAQVRVTVEERLPVLAWQQGEQTLWIDAEGIAFPPRGEAGALVRVEAQSAPPDLAEKPEAGAPGIPKRWISPQLVSAALVMSENTPKDTPLLYTREHGLGWRDRRGWNVYFGTDVQDIEMKLRVYKAIVKRIKNEDVRPAFVSVEYVHAPYIRLER